ncbi:hypothetical protein GCM10022226_32300 [Sphaerisporangium flaviroseum]|uniref:Histidine kinase/HSP90-like ATPase domain-containing protein n=1 Tax=Sphaerisporangium flaviroseum TaxID=509199 RepID=A0ABP7I5A3_9ACTN
MDERPDGLRTVCWDLPNELAVVGKTRRLVRDVLIAWTLSDLADDVALVVGELLANAINYGAPPIRLSLWAGADDLCLRITDHGPELPHQLHLGLEACHGRGLPIVEALTDDYGITPFRDTHGKTVWARWCRSPIRTPPGHAIEKEHRS